jgi:hypothetical protein
MLWCRVMCGAAVIIKTKGEGACFTPQEQEGDGECFGGGGVVWKSSVVMVSGWQPAARERGKKRGGCGDNIMRVRVRGEG